MLLFSLSYIVFITKLSELIYSKATSIKYPVIFAFGALMLPN